MELRWLCVTPLRTGVMQGHPSALVVDLQGFSRPELLAEFMNHQGNGAKFDESCRLVCFQSQLGSVNATARESQRRQ